MGLFGRAKKITWEEEPETEPAQVEEVLEVQPNTGEQEWEPVKEPATVAPQPMTPRTVQKEQQRPRRQSTVTERLNRLHINDRMELMADVAGAVFEGSINSCIIGGSPGLGKTHTVVEELAKKKYKRVEHEDYIVIKAGVSAFGVYKFVVKMAEKAVDARAAVKGKKNQKGEALKPKIPVIIFDDVPFWNDKRFVDLLKALTDTSDRRTVSWLTDRAALVDPEEAKQLGKLPAQVDYTGGVIVITNEEEKKMNNAVLDRSMYLPIEVTDAEMQERMKSLIHKIEPKMDKKLKRDVLNWLLSDQYEGKERSMRTLVKSLKLAKANPQNWLRMVQVV